MFNGKLNIEVVNMAAVISILIFTAEFSIFLAHGSTSKNPQDLWKSTMNLNLIYISFCLVPHVSLHHHSAWLLPSLMPLVGKLALGLVIVSLIYPVGLRFLCLNLPRLVTKVGHKGWKIPFFKFTALSLSFTLRKLFLYDTSRLTTCVKMRKKLFRCGKTFVVM